MDDILQHIPWGIDSDALVDALASDDDVRALVAAVVGHLRVKTPQAIKQLSSLLMEPDDRKVRRNAAVALAKIRYDEDGDVDIHALTADLYSNSVPVRARAAALLGAVESPERIPAAVAALEHALSDASVDVRRVVIDALGRLGRPAISTLTTFAGVGDDLCYDALETLLSIGGPVIPDLVDMYHRSSLKTQRAIMWAIESVDTPPREVLAFVIRVLQEEDLDLCWKAIAAVENYGPDAAEAVPWLVHALTGQYKRFRQIPVGKHDFDDDDDDDIRTVEAVSDIVDALGAIGSGARPAVPRIMQLLDDEEDIDIRRAAFQTICKIGPSEGERARLISYLTEEDADNRWPETIQTLLDLGVSEEELERLVDFYLRAFDADDGRFQYCCVLAEAIQSHGSARCRSLLTDGLKARSASVVERAALVIAGISDLASTVAPQLVDALDIREKDACCAILLALGLSGRPDIATPVLLEALRQEDERIRREAALALGRLGVASPEILSLLRRGMDSWDPEGRLVAAFAVWKLDPTSDGAISLLMAPLSREDWNLSSWSEFLLLEIGRPVVSALLGGLADENLRVDAITDILEQAKLGLTSEELSGTILEYLSSRDWRLRYGGADLVRKLPVTSESSEIIGYLWQGLADESPHVRSMSAGALNSIMCQSLDERDRPTIRFDPGL